MVAISSTILSGEASEGVSIIVDLTPSLSRFKMYRIIDISRVCEFYIIRIAFVVRLDGTGEGG